MIIPKEAWKRKIGEPLESPGTGKIIGPEGGLPNFDDGYYQGIPLGGLGAGTICQSYRGDFSKWHLEIGKHIYKTIFPCQFAFYENGNAVVLNEYKPPDGSLSAWNFQRPNGNYHALYPIAIFEYKDLHLYQEQFTPILPHNYQESSYPLAIFRWHILNPKKTEREVSILWSWKSIFGSNQNIFYQENVFAGLIFDNLTGNKNHKYGQMGIFTQKEGVDVTYLNTFTESGTGRELWKTFSKNGVLPGGLITETRDMDLKDSPGAIAAKVRLQPYENKVVTFVLAWDFPIYESGNGTKWYKRYTNLFGKDGRNVVRMARKAFNNQERWLVEVNKWQEAFLRSDKPDWFKSLLLNELYYLADGGTVWTSGKPVEVVQEPQKIEGSEEIKAKEKEVLAVSRQEAHFGCLECYDYPFYETLDVRFYGSFPLLVLWPELEKIVLKDYIKTVNVEMKEKVFFNHPLDQSTAERKLKGALPHDLGAPYESPFSKINSYNHVNINLWKDLNSKFVLLIYRYFFTMGKTDIDFLKFAWKPVVEALTYLKKFDRDNDCLIENDNIPDQTYDNWTMHGPSTYCNGLWLAALAAAIEMAKALNEDHNLFLKWFETGKENLETKLWNGDYYKFDTQSPHGNSIMADQLCGQWYADLLGLGNIFKSDRVETVLRKIYEYNVKKVGDGKIGAINGMNPDGSLLPESQVWRLNTQSNEIWSGVSLALACHMYIRGLKEEALETAQGVYSTVYDKKGYWFRTPEAWDINGNFRASLYQRSGAVWAFTLVPEYASNLLISLYR